jgi:hypothetical protein
MKKMLQFDPSMIINPWAFRTSHNILRRIRMMVSFMPIKFDIARMAQQFAICKTNAESYGLLHGWIDD